MVYAPILMAVCQSVIATTSFKAVNLVQSSYGLALPTVLSSEDPDVSTLGTYAPSGQLGTCSLCSAAQGLMQVPFELLPPFKIMLVLGRNR